MQKRGKTALTLVGFAVMLAALLALMVSIGAGKDGFDIDEFFTYGLANSYQQPFLSTQTGSWISGKAFSDYLTAKGHAHEYLNVYENQIADVHPPLYYLFMHAVCSAFQNPPFTKWTGIGLNLFFFSLTQFGLLLLSARLLSDGEKLELTPPALLPGLLYGLSAGAASGVVFIRMYAMMTMWAVWLALALAELFIHGQTVWRMRALAAVLIVANYREFITRIDWSAVFDMRPIRRFLVVNRDIIVRTLCIVAVYTFFTGASARMEDRTLLAVNTILLQLFTLFSYMTDGFAQAAEALTGRFIGARDGRSLHRCIRNSIFWSLAVAAVFVGIYLVWWRDLLHVFTLNSPESSAYIIATAGDYIGWIIAIPIASSLPFLMDGIMVGATRTRVMRDSMILSTIIYFAIFFAFSPLIGNNALWCAFLLYMLLRGVLQYFMTHRLKDIYRQADAA